jgi:hypothetical protein
MKLFRSAARRNSVLRKTWSFLFLCAVLNGCNSRHTSHRPTIEFTQVPPAEEGGPEKLDHIEGRVNGARSGQQLVLFAKAGSWWIQPLANQPFTSIEPDSTWKSSTHLGTEYAALLVDPGYDPPAKVDVLPGEGGKVAAVSIIKGKPSITSAPPKLLQFSGYQWSVRQSASDRNGSPSNYDPANAWTDSSGFMHLRISHQSDRWACSEVLLTSNLGYGTYLFSVRDVEHFEPAVVFGIYTWDEPGTDPTHREMDIEMSRWGDPSNKNAQYVIQPYYIPANVIRFAAPAGLLTHVFHWEPGKASFETFRGAVTSSKSHPVASHVFTSSVPSSGGESVRMNLCSWKYGKVFLQNEAEVVIERVQYLP